MHIVGVLTLDDVLPFDLAVPGQVFGTATAVDGECLYDIRLCSPGRSITTLTRYGPMTITTPWSLDTIADQADTVVIPGHGDSVDPPPPYVIDVIKKAAARGARIASICTGALILAATGLLDGHRATTHWLTAPELARRHPRIEVDDTVLYVDSGQFLTSAGIAAGLDLCLHMVQRDHGASLAADTARRNVMPLRRSGGQAQFIRQRNPDNAGTLQPTLVWLEANLHRPITLEQIAEHAASSVRNLTRQFRGQVGSTPLQWLLRARVRRAQQLLESTGLPVERIAAEVGFGSAATQRRHFQRIVGVNPRTYRDSFR